MNTTGARICGIEERAPAFDPELVDSRATSSSRVDDTSFSELHTGESRRDSSEGAIGDSTDSAMLGSPSSMLHSVGTSTAGMPVLHISSNSSLSSTGGVTSRAGERHQPHGPSQTVAPELGGADIDPPIIGGVTTAIEEAGATVTNAVTTAGDVDSNHDNRVRVLCRFRCFLDRDSEWASLRSGWLQFDGAGGGGGRAREPDTVSVRLGCAWSQRGFDKVFQPGIGQEEIFKEVEYVAHGVAQGFNGTLFAYGQTGSGKTYTMGGATSTLLVGTPSATPSTADSLDASTHYPQAAEALAPPGVSPPHESPESMPGPPGTGQMPPSPPASGGVSGSTSAEACRAASSLGCEAGVIPRAVSTVLADANARKEQGWEFVLTATYVEIYNEKIRDLLDPANDNLKVKEHPGRGVEAAGAREVRVSTLEEAVEILREGARHRMTAATMMNQASSRSHTIFMLKLDQRDVVRDCKVSARLTLVDLAGSERAGKTGAEGRRLEEANSINVSLHTLGRVIRALSESASHVPFRDSKLTRLLQESLGGNSRTVLIICCSPEEAQAQETLSTLKFGECAKRVTTFASANVVAAPNEVAAQLSELRAEVVRLKRQLHDFQLREARRLEMMPSSGRSRRSFAVPDPRGSRGVLHRKWNKSPLSRAVSFDASFVGAGDINFSSEEESWSASSPRGWEQGASAWTSRDVGVPSPSTSGLKSVLIKPRAPLAVAVSPTTSSDPALPSSNGSGQPHTWNTPPTSRASSSARNQHSSGRGRRLWSEDEGDQLVSAAQAPGRGGTAPLGVRSGGTAAKTESSGFASDGADRYPTSRGRARIGARWKGDMTYSGSLSESGHDGEAREQPTSSIQDLPAATLAATAGAKAAAEAATKWRSVAAGMKHECAIRPRTVGVVDEDSETGRGTDEASLPMEVHDLRVVLARVQYLENGWTEKAKAYEKLLQLKDLRIESLVSAHRHGSLSGHDFAQEGAALASKAAAVAGTRSTASVAFQKEAEDPQGYGRGKRSPLHSVAGISNGPTSRGKRGTPKRRTFSSRSFGATPPPPPPSPMRPIDRPFALDTDTEDD